MMVFLMALLAFSVDLGYLMVARAELQRSADSSALSAAWELAHGGALYGELALYEAISDARSRATQYAALNNVCSTAPTIDPNEGNDLNGDVVVGYLSDLSNPDCVMALGNPSQFNAVRVRVRRDTDRNGNVPLFFAHVLGLDSCAMEAEATAALLTNIGGFRTPGNGGNLGILPFALDEETWEALLAGETDDDWEWDPVNQVVQSGPDGILEVNLFPQGVGSPGNRGTVDIGSNNNSTNDIARQILEGVSPEDLEYHDGELVLDANGELFLNGDTGISAGVKDELEEIKGQPRIIPIFREVDGPGNNATYTIVKFVGVRIMNVKLTGSMSSKRVIVQPALMVTSGVIPATIEDTSYLIFSPAHLVR